eukprot:m.7709 g.7709  ORF g.7709 m.7709 type:complete len:236 (+) comp2791_c0_seq2:52-759(+)
MPPLLVPPFRFSTVEPTLYRSAQPVPRNYEFLKTLGLKTVVALTPKEDKEFRRFADDEDIVVRHLTVKQACENVTLLPEQALLFLELVLNAENHPILVHCVNGTNTTGLVIAAVRKLQNISPAFAIAEFCRFTEDRVVLPEELQFVESLRAELQVPAHIPSWLWHNQAPSLTNFSLKFREIPGLENPLQDELRNLRAQAREPPSQANLRESTESHAEDSSELSRELQALDLALSR